MFFFSFIVALSSKSVSPLAKVVVDGKSPVKGDILVLILLTVILLVFFDVKISVSSNFFSYFDPSKFLTVNSFMTLNS